MLSIKTLLFALAAVAAAADVHPSETVAMTTPTRGPWIGNGNQTVATTTKVVMEYTTYCPEPTTLEFNGHTYTVTEATTLTITDCPCTVVEKGPQPTLPPVVAAQPSGAPPKSSPGAAPSGTHAPELVSGAADRLVQVGVAVFGAAVVGGLLLAV